MEFIYFTLVALLLYVVADKLLERIEIMLGRRLLHRSIIFFIILLTLSLASFALIRHLHLA